MRGARTDAVPFAGRGVGLLVTAAIVGLLLVATALLVRPLTHVDPRGRGSWRPEPLAFDAVPRDVALFVPACNVTAVELRAAGPGAGPLAIETFAAATDGSATRSGPATVLTPTDAGVYRLPMSTPPAWRAPLILRIRSADGLVTLSATGPVALETPHSWLGTLPCAFDGPGTRSWLALSSLLFVVLAAGGLATSWILRGAGVVAGEVSGGTLAAGATAMVVASTLLYGLVVPPFEPPDELAHLQYARYLATTGSLPREVPPPDSEWRGSSYEWVQQPLYYVGAAAVLRIAGLDASAPQLVLNPRSRLQPQGTEPTIYQHAEPAGDRTGHRALGLLRAWSLLMAVGTAWLVVRLTRRVTDDPVVVATVAGGLALIPQWCAVMGAVSTDPPATLLAAAATLAVVRLAVERITPTRLLGAGLLIGAAYAVKATAAFLVPMAGLACVLATVTPITPLLAPRPDARWRTLAVRLLWVGGGVVLAAGWIPLRAWVLYGDPQAFDFKRRILEAGGFVPTPGPMPWTPEFWELMRVMVFEPFWARFGSLGAGPLPGSRVWLAYAAASALLAALAGRALAFGLWSVVARQRWAALDIETRARVYVVALSAVGVATGLAGWAAVNLVPRADMVVHWTPRHILPVTAPAAMLVAAGLDEMRRRAGRSARATAFTCALALVGLAIAYLSVLRSALLTLHFGY